MPTKIITKKGTSAPTTGQVDTGELAVDTTNGRLYTKDTAGTAVIELGTNPAAEIQANAGITLPDNQKATFGASDDLQIYHDGSNSYISDQGTGFLYINTDRLNLKNAAGTENILQAISDGAVNLYYDNGLKLSTTSTGVDVTGTATGTKLIAGTSSDVGLSSTFEAYSDSYETIAAFRSVPSDGINPYLSIITSSSGVTLEENGSSYGSLMFKTGATERMRIDSGGKVGIGIISPQHNFHISSASDTGIQLTKEGAVAGRMTAVSTGLAFGVDLSNGTTERMRIDSSGNLLVGTTTASGLLTVKGNSGAGNAQLHITQQSSNIPITSDMTNASTKVCDWRWYGSTIGSISVNSGGTGVAYNTSSDYRLKEDIQPIAGATERLLALKPCNFAWKLDGSRTDGFIAHEAQEVVPEAVHGVKDAIDAEGKPEYQGIDQSKLVPLLTAALQEALAEIESLKARVSALEN